MLGFTHKCERLHFQSQQTDSWAFQAITEQLLKYIHVDFIDIFLIQKLLKCQTTS